MPRDNYNPTLSYSRGTMHNKTLRVADSQMTPRHVRTKLRMSSRYVRVLAIKRSEGKTTQYHPRSPRRNPHDVTPQNYRKTEERLTGRNASALLTALVAIASKTATNWGKVPRVYSTPPHNSPPTGYLSCGSMGPGGWVSKILAPSYP